MGRKGGLGGGTGRGGRGAGARQTLFHFSGSKKPKLLLNDVKMESTEKSASPEISSSKLFRRSKWGKKRFLFFFK